MLVKILISKPFYLLYLPSKYYYSIEAQMNANHFYFIGSVRWRNHGVSSWASGPVGPDRGEQGQQAQGGGGHPQEVWKNLNKSHIPLLDYGFWHDSL